MNSIAQAQESFGELIQSEFERIERMKQDREVKDFGSLDQIVVGILPGDGIGPIIMEQAIRVIKALIPQEIARGKVKLRHIEGMTIENRAATLQSLPDEVFEEVKQCDVILKGPMVTPRAGEPWPNLVSANSLLRRGLELFAAKALTGLFSGRTLRGNISGAIRESRLTTTWQWTLRCRQSREASASPEPPLSLPERTARRM